ncbi:hypothetical protein L366_00146 [Klebsiella variicola]|nr:hypothetical protein L366_00146 [Klebsiella variicola]
MFCKLLTISIFIILNRFLCVITIPAHMYFPYYFSLLIMMNKPRYFIVIILKYFLFTEIVIAIQGGKRRVTRLSFLKGLILLNNNFHHSFKDPL